MPFNPNEKSSRPTADRPAVSVSPKSKSETRPSHDTAPAASAQGGKKRRYPSRPRKTGAPTDSVAGAPAGDVTAQTGTTVPTSPRTQVGPAKSKSRSPRHPAQPNPSGNTAKPTTHTAKPTTHSAKPTTHLAKPTTHTAKPIAYTAKSTPKPSSHVSKPTVTPGSAGVAAAAGGPHLRVIPLGGMREIGKNMTVYEYGNDMIIVDCGIAFPEEDMPGIDVVIPDFSYVYEHRQKIRGIFITHGHEDHIGALPYLLKDLKVPVYANHLPVELIRGKLEDRGTGVTNAQLIKVKDGDVVSVGCFSVEFIHVNHSIDDANALVVRTPAGIIYHSGDFKIDHTPIHGKPMDLARIGAIGDEGVLLMVCESTNIERSGYTSSERKVGETLTELFGKAAGRIFVTTFSSNVSRVQQIVTAAETYGRKVALVGRSMLKVFNAANELGYIDMKPDTLIDVTQIDRYPANQLVLITTGSQGEPLAALTRMAFSEHRSVEIVPGDTVILSSSAIPGNEKSVYRVINELYRRGAHVIYESLSEIHVSGHAYQEELKTLHNLLRPAFFIPAHGEYRHLYRHAELANKLGTPWERIYLLGNGDIFDYQPDLQTARISGFINAEGVLIDGSGVGNIDNLVLRERRLLSDDGVVAVFMAIDSMKNELIGQPDIQTRGFMYESENDRIVLETQKKILGFARKADQGNKPLAAMLASNQLKDQLRDLLFERTRRRPVILLSVIEI